jgi:site-specific DNA recombinase
VAGDIGPEKANALFVEELKKYIPEPAIGELNRAILNEIYNKNEMNLKNEYKEITNRVDEINDILSKARKKLITEEIDASDYRQFKLECEEEVRSLESKLMSLNYKPEAINTLLDKAFNKLSHLNILYNQSSIVQKREIISSIFPEKLTFGGFNYRTIRLNEAVRLIYSPGKGCNKLKKGTKCNFSQMYPKVTPQRLELWTR